MGTQPQPFPSCPKWPLRAKRFKFQNFSSVFVRRPFRAKGSPPKFENRNFTSGLTFDVHFVRKGCAWHLKIAILPQFLTFDVHFVRKGFDWHLKIAILRQFLTFDLHFVRKGCAWHLKIAILHQFLTFDVHFVQKGFDWHLKIAILRQFLTFDVHFVRKGCGWHLKIGKIRAPRQKASKMLKKTQGF